MKPAPFAYHRPGDLAGALDRLAELREIGADNFSVYLMHDDADATLDTYAQHIIGTA